MGDVRRENKELQMELQEQQEAGAETIAAKLER